MRAVMQRGCEALQRECKENARRIMQADARGCKPLQRECKRKSKGGQRGQRGHKGRFWRRWGKGKRRKRKKAFAGPNTHTTKQNTTTDKGTQMPCLFAPFAFSPCPVCAFALYALSAPSALPCFSDCIPLRGFAAPCICLHRLASPCIPLRGFAAPLHLLASVAPVAVCLAGSGCLAAPSGCSVCV